MKTRQFFLGAVLLTVAAAAQAGWQDWLDQAGDYLSGDDKEPATEGAVSQEDAAAGLREALQVGAKRAVATLAREGGYLNDPAVRIPMPKMLRPVADGLDKLGQGHYADAFVENMNRAAEKAAPEAAAIFTDAASGMSVEDAWGVLKGGDDAATHYFRGRTEEQLFDAFLPIVREATASARVTSAYKTVLDQAGPYTRFVDPEQLDLDRYVTREALDGLFVKLAEEEKRIREDPAARSTELLQMVFGNLGG